MPFRGERRGAGGGVDGEARAEGDGVVGAGGSVFVRVERLEQALLELGPKPVRCGWQALPGLQSRPVTCAVSGTPYFANTRFRASARMSC